MSLRLVRKSPYNKWNRPVKITSEEVRLLYEQNNFSLQEIADHFHVSRQAIHYHVKRLPKPPVFLEKTCEVCGNKFLKKRVRGRLPHHDYCGYVCAGVAKQKEKHEGWRELAAKVFPDINLEGE